MNEQNFIEDIGGDEEEVFTEYDFIRDPCYGIRIVNNKVCITKDNKTVVKLAREDFPPQTDWNDVSTIGNMIRVIREEGLHALLNSFGISITLE